MPFGTTVEKENTAKRQKEGRQQLLTPSKRWSVTAWSSGMRDSNHLWVAKASHTGKYQQLRNGCEHCQRAWEQIPHFCSRLDPAQTLGFSRSLAQPAADPCSTLAHSWSRESLRSSQVRVPTALNWLSSPGSVLGLAGKLALHQAGKSCTRN